VNKSLSWKATQNSVSERHALQHKAFKSKNLL